jgi:hypothetical protein
MRWKSFEVVAIRPEPGAATPFRGEGKMLAPTAGVIHEPDDGY